MIYWAFLPGVAVFTIKCTISALVFIGSIIPAASMAGENQKDKKRELIRASTSRLVTPLDLAKNSRVHTENGGEYDGQKCAPGVFYA